MPKKARRALRILRDARRRRIPFIAYRTPSGAPEFGRVDGGRIRHVLTHDLCGFCVVPFHGEESCYLAQVDDQGTVVEVPAYRHQAPMHPACLETALRLAPNWRPTRRLCVSSQRATTLRRHSDCLQRSSLWDPAPGTTGPDWARHDWRRGFDRGLTPTPRQAASARPGR